MRAPASRTQIDTWTRQPGMLGMRFTFHKPWLQSEELAWIIGRGICAWLCWPL